MNIDQLNSPQDLITRRRSSFERFASQDWEWQQRMCVQALQEAAHDRALQAEAVSFYRSPACMRLLQQTIERNQQRPAYAGAPPAGMIFRSGSQSREQHRGDQARDNRRLAEIKRQVVRERGY